MIALAGVAVAVTAIAFIFCTTVGVKMVMDDCLSMGLCNIAMGVGNLLLCICNIVRLVSLSAGAQFIRIGSSHWLCLWCYSNS